MAWPGVKKNAGSHEGRVLQVGGLVERYEELRAFALGRPVAGTPGGLALFLRRGMPGWLEAWSRCTPATRVVVPRLEAGTPGLLSGTLQVEVAVLLAQMALGVRQEVRG